MRAQHRFISINNIDGLCDEVLFDDINLIVTAYTLIILYPPAKLNILLALGCTILNNGLLVTIR